MREQILQIFKDYPRHFSRMIQHRDELKEIYQWVIDNSPNDIKNFAEKIYIAVFQANNVCKRGKVMKFNGMNSGYLGCGSSHCECANAARAVTVKKTKAKVTPEQQAVSNALRAATNLVLIGHVNAGQSPYAIQQRANTYKDPIKVASATRKYKATCLAKYGVDNPMKLPSIVKKSKATCLAKYGFESYNQTPEARARSSEVGKRCAADGTYLRHGYNRVTRFIAESYNFEVLTPFENYKECLEGDGLELKCFTCGYTLIRKSIYKWANCCPYCSTPTPRQWASTCISQEEQDVFDFITNELGIRGRQSDRSLINPYEVDMVFEDQKVAVEYCGLYWHSEISTGKSTTYHRMKTTELQAKGYRLITIFSDEWLNHPEIVKKKLRDVLQPSLPFTMDGNAISHVPTDEMDEFVERNSLQHDVRPQLAVGYYIGDNLVAMVGFNQTDSDDVYEYVGYVTDGTNVAECEEVLLAYFIEAANAKEIYTTNDHRWEIDDKYLSLGFEKINEPYVDFMYTYKYEHRVTAIDESIDESDDDQMRENRHDRIWDCGHQQFVLKCV